MDAKEWIVSPAVIQKSKKQYAHFDYRTDLSICADYVMDPEKIAKHGFYPFIHYEMKMVKYTKKKEKKEKVRDICYSAHIDRCVFQYYNFILNELYNRRVSDDGIYNVPIAYRTDLHKNNVHFSKVAFDYIRNSSPCYIMIGDFTKFFDNLDHAYLKQQWCSLLGVSHLPPDHYAVYKNITRFSTWELVDLLQLNGLKDTKGDRRKLNSKLVVLSKDQFKSFRSHVQKNQNTFGIPQGSPMSALLANVYMLDIDRQINEVVTSLGGLYMRYSDDFIIVLPFVHEQEADETLTGLTQYINSKPGLTLEPEKTQYFFYDSGQLENCGLRFHANADSGKRFINFLGFTFDGNKVSIRSKTISKYYYKMYRKARTIRKNGGYTHKGTRISCKNLYKRYSHHGAKSEKGNFLTYVMRSKQVFGNDELIERDTRRHMQKIRKALKIRRKR